MGLDVLHIRKPHSKGKEIYEFIKQIDEIYHRQIMLHDHFDLIDEFHIKGIHINHNDRKGFWFKWFTLPAIKRKHKHMQISYSAQGIRECIVASKRDIDYIMLGRIFSTHSKSGLNPQFDIDELKHMNNHIAIPVIAQGGINDTNVHLLKSMGFSGFVIHKYIWENSNPITAFEKIITQV